jgi:glycosyltransferase involved in cell wall biosynthesis
MPKLSIVVPAYNEERTLGSLLERIHAVDLESAGFSKEIIVVDDGSRDRTAEVARRFANVKVLSQANQGKGRAVQNGIAHASGDYVLVQDADLEYDPGDYVPMVKALESKKEVCVYGSRVLGQIAEGRRTGKHPQQGIGPWVAGVILSFWTFLLYGRWISDTLTGYKLYPTNRLRGMPVRTHGFETDHELTAKFVRAGVTIREVPVRYYPRDISEGKKIRGRDGLIAVWTLLKYRFTY